MTRRFNEEMWLQQKPKEEEHVGVYDDSIKMVWTGFDGYDSRAD
jgi:hypothetical protein